MLKSHVTQASDASTMTISGLSGDSEGYYTIIGRFIMPSASGTQLTIRPNGLTTNLLSETSNQYGGVARAANWEIAEYTNAFTASGNLVLDININMFTSKTLGGVSVRRSYRSWCHIANTATNLESYEILTAGVWDETSTEITSLVFNSSLNNILAGSQLLVYTPNDTFTV